ncbi:MAG: phosphoenolpyruvate--protein phosphotransferase [Bdellovibrio sp. CG10_big_fil_rev_8_21_14_0_10_47_8]|nr:MAG: phosphoenolpyruvate--protein phosphotransferase [Bdellovibrio sp. CG10_big_fil_rev_8_21_14_0_10_47_8]
MSAQVLQGISVSPGFALAPAVCWHPVAVEIRAEKNTDASKEWSYFQSCLPRVQQQLQDLIKKTAQELSDEEAQIFESQYLFTEDPEILSDLETEIRQNSWKSIWAVEIVFEKYAQMMAAMSDSYLRERALDLRDLKSRLQVALSLGPQALQQDAQALNEKCILIAQDLTPSDFASMDKKKVQGLVLEANQRTSHTVILAKTYGIPTLVGVVQVFEKIKNKDLLALNATRGTLYLNPSDQTKNEIQSLMERDQVEKKELQKYKDQPILNREKEIVHLEANITSVHDLPLAAAQGAEGVGLFRTEFLFLERATAPSEDEQFEIYKKVLQFNPQWPVIIRTLDIGGDKQIPYLNLAKEENPFLGVRGLRLCLRHLDLFKTQLRALLRASSHGKLKIMFPMVTNIEEIQQAQSLIKSLKQELKVTSDFQVGMMVETPASALMIPEFSALVDFVSVGTNDLTQYILAVDRMNSDLADLYQFMNPAVLKTMEKIIQDAKSHDLSVGVCGEMASDPVGAKWLMDHGVRELSMNPNSLLRIRRLLIEE